jgi:hypothetical protein
MSIDTHVLQCVNAACQVGDRVPWCPTGTQAVAVHVGAQECLRHGVLLRRPFLGTRLSGNDSGVSNIATRLHRLPAVFHKAAQAAACISLRWIHDRRRQPGRVERGRHPVPLGMHSNHSGNRILVPCMTIGILEHMCVSILMDLRLQPSWLLLCSPQPRSRPYTSTSHVDVVAAISLQLLGRGNQRHIA